MHAYLHNRPLCLAIREIPEHGRTDHQADQPDRDQQRRLPRGDVPKRLEHAKHIADNIDSVSVHHRVCTQLESYMGMNRSPILTVERVADARIAAPVTRSRLISAQ